MREIRTSGSMSGDGKRSVAAWPKLPRPSSTLRYCCKNPKLPGANFLAVKKSDRRPPIDVASITLPRSPVSLSSGDEVPHIRESRVYSQKKKCTLVPHEPAMIHFGHLAGRSLPARKVQSRDYVWLSLYVRQSMDHYA